MPNTATPSLYLKNVNLSGYKSIEDVDIELQKGLNIIIGKNAAGKTNFLRFLNRTLNLDYNDFSNFSSELNFENGKKISIKSSNHLKIDEILSNRLKPRVETILKIGNKIVKDKKDQNNSSLWSKLRDNEILFSNTFVCHGIPNDYLVVDKPFSFKIEIKNRLSSEMLSIVSNNNTSSFLKTFLINMLVVPLDNEANKEVYNVENLRKLYSNVFTKIQNMQSILETFSPIEDIKVSDNFNIFVSEDKDEFTVNNIFLEFKINNDWIPFSSLSDGTKRIFYIISEVFDFDQGNRIRSTSGGLIYSGEVPRVILIEEPELGIHPHQFRKLMAFISEQSKFNQILITTHSPQSLDILTDNDLSRIIIAYSTQDGTKLKHLNSEELEKAKIYIKEEFLSDYWLYSDLEN